MAEPDYYPAFHILAALLRTFTDEPELIADREWDALALITDVEPHRTSVTAHRYTYDSRRPVPTKLEVFDHDLLRDYQWAWTEQHVTPWRACIIKVERDSGRVVTEFVYGADAEAWMITPSTIDQLAERARPDDFVSDGEARADREEPSRGRTHTRQPAPACWA